MSKKLTALDLIAEWATNTIHNSEQRLKEFTKRWDESGPIYAFEWSLADIQAAARLHVAKIVEKAIDEQGVTFESLHTYAKKQLLHKARHPSRSTSPIANLVDEEELAAWATFVDDITWMGLADEQ